MALSNLSGWRGNAVPASACGALDKPHEAIMAQDEGGINGTFVVRFEPKGR